MIRCWKEATIFKDHPVRSIFTHDICYLQHIGRFVIYHCISHTSIHLDRLKGKRQVKFQRMDFIFQTALAQHGLYLLKGFPDRQVL